MEEKKQYGRNKVVWDANGCSNLPILNAHIGSHVLHMTKEDCLKNLPPKTRVRHKVVVSQHFEIMYTNSMNDLVCFFASNIGHLFFFGNLTNSKLSPNRLSKYLFS